MEPIICPHCQHGAGFDPSTGEIICSFCGVLEPPCYEVKSRPMFAMCAAVHAIPPFGQNETYPLFAYFIEVHMHLQGIDEVSIFSMN